MSLSQVQPGRRSEVRRDRAGDGDCMNLTSSSAAQRPYKNTHTHTHSHINTLQEIQVLDNFRKSGNFFSFVKKTFLSSLFLLSSNQDFSASDHEWTEGFFLYLFQMLDKRLDCCFKLQGPKSFTSCFSCSVPFVSRCQLSNLGLSPTGCSDSVSCTCCLFAKPDHQ